MRTVAMVGFADVTMLGVHTSKAKEVWTMNHAYLVGGMPRTFPDSAANSFDARWEELGKPGDGCADWYLRLDQADRGVMKITRLFEMHTEGWIRRGHIPEHEKYWAWLCQEHDFEIVMHDVHPDVPNSVKYPFEEVVAMSFRHLLRMHGQEEVEEKYFTNSFDFMMPCAVFEGYERAELYGIEMETNTEYGYQKPGASYHIGFANGRGVDVVLPEGGSLCNAKLYGYEAVPAITPDDLQRYHDYYEPVIPGLVDTYHKAAEHYNANHNDQKAFEEMFEAAAVMNTYRGAFDLSGRFDGWVDKWLSRQNLENMHVMFLKHFDQAQANLNVKHGRYRAYGGHKASRRQHLFDIMMKASASMYANSGAAQLTEKLLGECDMIVGDPSLAVDVKMMEAAK